MLHQVGDIVGNEDCIHGRRTGINYLVHILSVLLNLKHLLP